MGNCVVCGKELPKNKKRYCSPACAKEAEIAQNRERKAMIWALGRECVVCGKRFYPEFRQTKTCSDECKRLHNLEMAGAKKHLGEMIPCAECGKLFASRTHNSKFCSAACCKKRNKREYRETFVAARQMQRNTPRKLPVTLGEIVREAAKSGLTYGQYVARMEAGEI